MVNERIARNFEKARRRLERLSQLRADTRLSIELSSKVITESRALIARLDTPSQAIGRWEPWRQPQPN
jgi:hypothetical protein